MLFTTSRILHRVTSQQRRRRMAFMLIATTAAATTSNYYVSGSFIIPPVYAEPITTGTSNVISTSDDDNGTCTSSNTQKQSAATNNDITTPSEDRLSFWQNRWVKGNLRWHKNVVHPSLQQYLDQELLGDEYPAGGAKVLVPLCGKTIDMEFLARNRKISKVIGIDGIQKAAIEFANEHPDFNIQKQEGSSVNGNNYEIWKGDNTISILVGDFLEVRYNEEKFDFAWDRAALVAIKPELREQYINKYKELIRPNGGKILLSTYVRPNNDITTGPPFSIDENEVRKLFENQPWVESVKLLDTHSAITMEKNWYKALLLYLQFGNTKENIFLITTK